MIELNAKLADRIIEAYADLDELTQEECRELFQGPSDSCACLSRLLQGDGNVLTGRGKTRYIGVVEDDAYVLEDAFPEAEEFRSSLSGEDGARALHARVKNLIGPDYLGNSDPAIRVKTVQALGEMGSLARDARPALVVALQDENRDVREWTADALGKVGLDDPAVFALIAALEVNDAWLCQWVANAFSYGRNQPDLSSGAKEKETSAMIEAMERDWPVIPIDTDAGRDCKCEAAQALGGLGIATPEVVDTLIEALGHNDSKLRAYAAIALGDIGHAMPEKIVPALIKRLKREGDRSVRSDIIGSLGKIGPATEEVVPTLMRTLKVDKNWWVRMRAAEVLGDMSPLTPGVVTELIKALIRLLKEREIQFRKMKISLEDIFYDRTGLAFLDFADRGLVMSYWDAIDELNDVCCHAGPEAVPVLMELSKDGNPIVRKWADHALREIGHESITP
ncbi:MAG: HEAT repeat domain-containing protein [bacterium]